MTIELKLERSYRVKPSGMYIPPLAPESDTGGPTARVRTAVADGFDFGENPFSRGGKLVSLERLVGVSPLDIGLGRVVVDIPGRVIPPVVERADRQQTHSAYIGMMMDRLLDFDGVNLDGLASPAYIRRHMPEFQSSFKRRVDAYMASIAISLENMQQLMRAIERIGPVGSLFVPDNLREVKGQGILGLARKFLEGEGMLYHLATGPEDCQAALQLVEHNYARAGIRNLKKKRDERFDGYKPFIVGRGVSKGEIGPIEAVLGFVFSDLADSTPLDENFKEWREALSQCSSVVEYSALGLRDTYRINEFSAATGALAQEYAQLIGEIRRSANPNGSQESGPVEKLFPLFYMTMKATLQGHKRLCRYNHSVQKNVLVVEECNPKHARFYQRLGMVPANEGTKTYEGLAPADALFIPNLRTFEKGLPKNRLAGEAYKALTACWYLPKIAATLKPFLDRVRNDPRLGVVYNRVADSALVRKLVESDKSLGTILKEEVSRLVPKFRTKYSNPSVQENYVESQAVNHNQPEYVVIPSQQPDGKQQVIVEPGYTDSNPNRRTNGLSEYVWDIAPTIPFAFAYVAIKSAVRMGRAALRGDLRELSRYRETLLLVPSFMIAGLYAVADIAVKGAKERLAERIEVVRYWVTHPVGSNKIRSLYAYAAGAAAGLMLFVYGAHQHLSK